MELSGPLRWVAAIGVMFVVVLIAGSLLLNTLSNTVRLASGASEDPTTELAVAPSEGEEDGGGGDGGGGDGGGEDGDGEDDGGGDGGGDEEFPQEYTVQEGDTGAKIAEEFYDDQDGWPAIAEANDIDPGAPLRVGDELEIPAPE